MEKKFATNYRPKSFPIEKDMMNDIRRIRKQFDTFISMCIYFNIDPSTFNRAIHYGKTSPDTFQLLQTGIDRFQKEQNCLTA
jgi:hypothetical protein